MTIQPESGSWSENIVMSETYAELGVTTNFTFLTGASHPEELVMRACELGLPAMAITDRNSVAGVVRGWTALRELRRKGTGEGLPKLIAGSRLVLRDCPVEWLALPTGLRAWQRLSRLLSRGKRRAEKGDCDLRLDDLLTGCAGLILIALPPADGDPAPVIRQVRQRYPGDVFLGAAPRYDGSDQDWFNRCALLAQRVSAPMVAVGDVLMHRAARRPLADVLTCIREGCTIDTIGTRALANAERRLKSPADMARLFRHHPAAIRRSVEIAARCAFDLGQLGYDYPDEISGGEPPQARLERLALEGLVRRCPDGVPPAYRALADKELALVAELKFAAYFLTVHDIVAHARSIGILCQGRGSAANSILCWALGITDVAPDQISMVFERFVSRHRGEPPDIDVDFEHERREEVIQWIYARYGRHRAGLCATVIHFRSRAAIREVGKVMGLSQDVTAGLSGQIWGISGQEPDPQRLREVGLDPGNRRLMQTVDLIRQIIGFPRHLSQHVGGFVITRGRLDELCPIENAAMEDRTVIEWDKDDIDALGLLKVDVLGLGMLTAIRKAFGLLQDHRGIAMTLATLRPDAGPA
ncbi:PHP domain-containing protein [Paracoccus sp. (in: a-proteobacteria)]|uniref:PHP domain-containing protein n=1 Tax=Paracoccus sp. TaxID=267 RepID=UPI003A85BA82